MSGNLSNNIVEIGQNTKKSPGDLSRLAVTQIPAKKPSANANVRFSQKENNNSLDFEI